ncbi:MULTISPECIES: hypothetical protein [Bacillus]|uniref:hypothetical protein n=1 Tax=Bacillus TaxID=1386 RepID=UPI00146BA0F5|nr:MULTISPECIES: hypothetical protein [Bacillus]MCY7576680.1 hypothetical protein [Bacillus pumilus]
MNDTGKGNEKEKDIDLGHILLFLVFMIAVSVTTLNWQSIYQFIDETLISKFF